MDFIIILLYIFLGILLGIIIGLTPGLHPNTVAIILLSFSFLDPFLTCILIISTAITHTFLDFIPSIFLGAPSSGTSLSVLPGHKMMMKGRGYEALMLTVVGGIISLIFVLLFIPITILLLNNLYCMIKANVYLILLGVAGYMFLRDRNPWGVIVFILSGTLGYLSLNNNLVGVMILLPILTGLFGSSMIIYSLIRGGASIPEQENSVEYVGRNEYLMGGLVGSISGILVGILPGIGAAQATFLSHEALKDRSERKFMIAMGQETKN